MIELKNILLNILNEYGRGIAKTRLLKLAYLIELDYYRKNRTRLINEDWVYYKYGPYIFNYDNILKSKDFIINNENDDFTLLEINNINPLPQLPIDISTIIRHVVKDFANIELNKLLDYVYFDTEPMMFVEERGEVLNFEVVQPAEFFKIKSLKLTESDKTEIRNKLKERMHNVIDI